MKAILKPFFALCGLVALSTALSADSRLFPVGGGGAGWGEPGFLYSDYLQTAAASGREVEFQGSFVLDNRRPFLAELGTAFPGRVVDEVKSLPLREWGLGYVFEKRRPAHQRALLERGWRLADWLAEETLMAATESSRGGGLIRTLEFDLQSELGGRRAQVGLNVLGALRESNDEAIAWQFRGFKSSGGLGGNTGLIWRRAVANDRALAGANVFLDYETYADENFWRGSAGAELRSAWADVFGNVYRGFSDDVKKNNRTTYTADGYDVELNVHSPELPWLVGEVAYYNFEGKAGDKDDDGVRFGLRFNPLTDLELGVEYDNGDSDDDGKKKWAARIRYSGEFGGVLKAQYRPSTNSGNFEPRDWFFAPVEREYSQRIRKAPDTGSTAPTFTFSADSARLVAILPIRLQGQGGSLDLTIPALTTPSDPVILMGTVNGVTITPRTLTAVADAATNITTYRVMVAQARTGIITVTHKGGSMTYAFPRTDTTVTVESDVAISTRDFDFFRLIDGSADIMVGTSGGGTVFIVENVESTANNLTLITRLSVPIGAAPVPVTLKTNPAPGTPKIQAPTNIGVLVQEVTVASDGVRTTMSQGTLSNPQGRVVLAQSNFLIPGTPPVYYRAKSASGAVIVATLEATGGVGGYQWSKNSGALTISPVGVVRIPSDETATDNGKELVLDAKLIDGREANNPATEDSSLKGLADRTNDFMLTLTLEYRNIADLAASFNPSPAANVYGLTGEGQEIVVATVVAAGGPGDFTYAKTSGQLDVRSAGGNGGFGHVYIPSGVVPVEGGSPVTLRAELSQPLPDDAETRTVAFSLTVKYIGVSRISPPAFAHATDKAILVNSPTSYQVTALSTDDSVMNIATLAEATGGGGSYTYTKVGNEGLGFSGRVVSIPSGVSPNGQRLGLTVRISDSGTGEDATPDVTVMLTVQYVSVNTINLSFDDRAPTNPNDGLVTVYGLQGQMTAYANVARVVAGGGFGGVTVGKVGGDLDLSGTASGAQINIPQGTEPTGQELLITVLANEPSANDPRGITDEARATATVKYEQVPTLNATFSRVNARNGQVGSALGERVLTVGMTTTNPSEFTVAKVVAAGGVGAYTYTKQRGNSQLLVNDKGEVLIDGGTPPGNLNLTVVVQVDDSGDNSQVSPAFLASLTVFYNTIGVIAAEVVDTRNNAVPSVIKADGGTVYFLSAGGNASTEFGRLEVNGGLGNQISDYTIDDSNASGLTYNDTTRILSMNKCTSGTKSIRFTINDDSVDSGDTTEDLVFNFSVTNECVGAIAAQLRNADNSADATSPLEIFGVEGKTEATVVAAWMGTGGGGDLTWTPSGDLRLVAGNDNKVRQVQIPAGTSPEASPGNPLSVTVVVNDENDKGGFLTEPLTVEATVNYVEVASVRLALTRGGNPINSVVDVYGVEGVAKTGAERKVADIAATRGAGGALAVDLQTSGTGATTPDSFMVAGNNVLNLVTAFPPFADGAALATAAVVASDTGPNSEATPNVTMRATVRLLPVLGRVEEGGDIVVVNMPNVIQPPATSKTETAFTVYVLEGEKEADVIARINPASVARNAAVAGLSGLRVVPFDSTTTGSGTGLEFELEGQVAAVKIEDSATPTSSGADLNLVLTYVDEANAGTAAADVAVFTQPRMKTVNVKYFEVAAFEPKVRNAAGSADLTDTAEVYAGETDTAEKVVAKLMKEGGADGDLVVGAQSGDTTQLLVKPNGDVVLRDGIAPDDKIYTVTVEVDDPAGAAGSVTETETLAVTVQYNISRDVIANFAPIAAGANDKHFIGALQADGTRTVFLDATAPRAALPLFQLRAQSGTGEYTYDSTGTGFNLAGFVLAAGDNNRVLSLEDSVTGGAKAYATVQVDDSGNGADQTEPATAAVTVEVKLVTAIATELLVPADVPGGAPAGTTLGGLYVRSAAAAESSSVYIASVVARGGVEEFTYTRQSESSAELLLNDDGQVHLAANYTPDGNKTLSILIAVNDTGDGSTLTDAAMMTLQFVLAETIKATAFLRSNGGAYLPSGSGDNVAVGSDPLTVRVKTDDYDDEQVLFGVSGSGGLGNMGYAIERVAGTNENGLVARGQQAGGQRNYDVEVVVKSGASSAPQTLGITAVVNESTADPNNFTPGATISLTVVYDDVEPITAAFNDTDGNAISGVHVVVRDTGRSSTPLHVADVVASDGVGDEGGTNSYTYTQTGTGDLLINPQGRVEVAANVEPKLTDNDLVATVVIDDRGNWAHISEPLTMTITVRYSSKLVLVADINDPRQNAVPSAIPLTEADGAPARIYFDKAGADAGQVLAQLAFRGGKAGSTYSAAASQQTGLTYDDTTKQISMTKCTDTPNALKSIRLVVNDAPDDDNVSDPLTLDITVRSGVAECIEPINAQARTIGNPNGQAITEDLTAYALAGVTSTAVSVVATVFVDKGAGEYTSTSSGGNVLALVGDGKGLLTVQIPVGAVPGAAPNGTELNIDIRINDEDDKGGFLTDEAQVEITVNYIAVQPHGQFTAQKAADVLGEVSSGVLTVRRVAQQSGTINILTNIRGANAAEERILPMGGSSGIRFQADPENAGAGKLVVEENQNPDGAVRIITLRVEDYKPIGDTADDRAQFDARPDRLFTISVYYYGELEGAAYDSENTANAISEPVNRYVEQRDSNVAVAVASLSVSGGTPAYSYNLTGELALADNNASLVIPASENPAAAPGTALTARIVIDDNGRTDTAPLTVELTANYILISGHSDLQLVRDGRTQAEDLNGETVYPKIVGAKSSGVVEALSGLAFKAGLSGETLKRESSGSAAALLYADDASVVQIAGDTEPDGSTFALVLRASDGESPAQAKARSDRLYTLQVRYMKELTADARTAASGGDVINAVRQIRVTEAEATKAHFVAHISVDGGAGGNVIAVEGTNFVISGNELQIAADVTPGDFASGKLLTATVKVNDDENAVGGADTGEVEILVTANYITLPPVAGGFVEGRDGNTAVPTSGPVTVYSAWTPNPQSLAPATVAATATAVVDGRSGDNFTFHKIGTEGKLEVDVNSGAVTLQPNRPGSPNAGNYDLHVITVEFRALTNAVATRQTLTVRHQMLKTIISGNGGMTSRTQCYPGVTQHNGNNQATGQGTQIIVVLPTREEGTEYSLPQQCDHYVNAQNNRTALDPNRAGFRLVRTARDASGLELYSIGGNYRVRLAGGTPPTYTADRQTLSLVIVNTHGGPGGHVVPEFLQTVYVVFPGVPKLEAVLEDASGADAAITKPLTVYVGDTDASAKVVASVKASGGEGTEYSYTGTRTGGDDTALLLVTTADSNEIANRIAVPAGFVAKVSPGTEFRFEVAVNDTGGNAARRGATPERKVILTLQYIKTSGPLQAEAAYTTPDIADAANTTYYGAKGEALGAAVNVANIAPSGGIPNYSFAIEEDSSNPAANSELEISGSGNTRVVRLKSGATPSAATAEARRRVITVRVTDTGDVGNSIDQMTMDVVVSVNFVEVEPHGDLTVEDADGNNLSADFVVVTSGVSAQDVVLSEFVYPERPTRRQDLGREAAVVSEVSHHGLRFNSNGLVITANTPLEGQTLSVVVRATDGATSQPTASAQAAARQDQTYTISVRYVPAIAAEVLSTTDAALGNTDVVELTVVAGTQLVGKVSASGGVGGTYSYTPTPAQAGGTNLAVDADGNINIIAGTTPVAGDGLSITVNIAVDDDSANTEGDRDETSAANVQIRVKYVLLEDLALTAKDLQGNDVGTGATDTVGTFYLLEGQTTDAPVLVATVTASGGIKLTGGANDYTYAKKGGGGDLTFDTSSREVHIPDNKAAAAPDTADATLAVTVEATDKRGEKKELTVQAVFETVQPLLDLYVEDVDGVEPADPYAPIVIVGATSQQQVLAIGYVDKNNSQARTNDLTKVSGDEGGALIWDKANNEVYIPGGTVPEGQTLTLVLIASDGDRTDADKARPDRRHTLRVRYIPSLAAVARTADGTAVLSAPVEITAKPDTTHQVASISVSGGTSNTYTYSSAPLEAGRQNLNVSNDGIVSIPTGATPVANGGLSITVEITADDTGTDNGETDPAKARVTVIYHLLESPEIEAQNLAGTELDNTNTPTFYLLAGDDLDSDMPVAKVVGSKGSGSYSYAIFGANTNGMEVDSSTGQIVLKTGETAAAGANANRIITVRLTDTQPNAETADVTLTIRFEAVAPHPDLYADDTGDNEITDFGDKPLTVVVHPDTRAAQIVAQNLFVAAPSGNNADLPDLAKTKGELEYVDTSGILRIAAQTEPTGQLLSVVIEADDGADTPQKAARPNRLYSVTVRYMSHVAVAFTQNDGTTPLDVNNRINLQKIAGTPNLASIFVAKFEGRGGVGEITYSVSGNTESGKNVQYDTANRVLWIDSNVNPTSEGLEITVVVSADDSGEPATNGVTQNIAITYTEISAVPLDGAFAAAAPSANSRIVGAIADNERVTVFGLAADDTSANLLVLDLSHSNNNVAAAQISKQAGSGDLIYSNGQVFIPAANRKDFGTEFKGVFVANDGSPATQNATFEITVLLAQQLDEVVLTEGNAQGKGQYFYTTGSESATDYRPIFGVPAMPDGEFSMSPSGYQYDHNTKRITRNGAPVFVVGNPAAPYNGAPDNPAGGAVEYPNHRVTVFDSVANPKIVPKVFDLDMRHFPLPALAFTSQDGSAPQSTANQIPHTATPTTPIWTFRLGGGLLTRKPYRPFHNLQVSGSGAFVVATLARVDGNPPNTHEFVDMEVRVNANHADFVRDGRTLTLTVTAEDVGYPGLGAVSHVAEVILEQEPIPHVEAVLWTPEAAGTATQISAPVEIAVLAAGVTNVASVSVSKGLPAGNAVYTYTSRRIDGTGNTHSDQLPLILTESNGIINIPSNLAPGAGDGLTISMEIVADDTGESTTNAATVTLVVVYKMLPPLTGEAQDLAGTAIDPDNPPIFYRLVNDPIPSLPITGMPVAKVAASGGTPPYRYVVFGNTNPDRLGIDQTSGEVAIQTGQNPDSDILKKRMVTVRITDSSTPEQTANVIVTVIFRAVGRFGNLFSDTPANDADKNPAGDYVVVQPEAQSVPLVVLNSFGISRADSITKFGGASELILDTNAGGSRLRIAPNTVPGGNPPVPGGLTLVADLQANDDDSTPEKRVRPNRNGYLVTVVYLAEVDATVEDASNTEIPDLANVDISGAGAVASLYVADIKASGGTGEYTYTKAASGGGVLEVDDDGQVYIPSGQSPTAGNGTQLHILVNVNDTGDGGNQDNSGFTAQKQIRIDVDYILQLGLSGQTQQTDGTAVNGEHIVLRQAGDATPSGGLDAGVKVVGQNGEGTYQYAAAGTAADSQLEVSNTGEVKIKQGQTATGQLLLLTVQITDSASTPATALHTVSIRFNSVAPHADLTRVLAAGVTENSAGEFVVAQDGTQSSTFDVLTGIKSDEGAAVTRVGTDPIELQYVFNTFRNPPTGDAKIGGGTVPTGQTLELELVASDGTATPEAAARQDRTFNIAIRYLSHLQTPTLQDTNDADIDLSSAVEYRGPGGASLYVGDIAVSGGTGNYTFEKDGTTTGGLTVDANGQVYLRSDAVPTSGGAAFAMTVNVNDSGKDNEVTNGTAIQITVNYVLEAVTQLPLLGGDLLFYRERTAGFHRRICPNNISCLTGSTPPPEIIPTDTRLTMWGMNSDTGAQFAFNVGFSVPAVVTAENGSDFEVTGPTNSPTGTRYRVALKAANIKRWGQELEARLVATSPDGDQAQLVTVKVLLAERMPTSALGVGPVGIDGGAANRPMQLIYPNNFAAGDRLPGYQVVGDFPGVTVTGLEVFAVLASTRGPTNPVPIDTRGNFRWDEDTKLLRREGRPAQGGDPDYYVWLRGSGANPKIVPAVLTFRVRNRLVNPMTWATNPGTIPSSGVASFEVQGGSQSRNYSPFADMVATVDSERFVISNMSRTDGNNDRRFSFDVGVASGTPSGTYTATVTVTDRGYTSSGTLTQQVTVTVP